MKISKRGIEYIKHPLRDERGVIKTNYFKYLIIIYILERGYYNSADFKQHIKNLIILKSQDWDKTKVSTESKWRHRIDAAKQNLLKNKIIKEDFDGTFILNTDHSKVKAVIDLYMEH